MMKISRFGMVSAVMLAVEAVSSGAPANDAEIFAEKLTDERRYAGVFPAEVKTIGCISPASYPGNPSHRRGVALLNKAGYKVKIMPNAFKEPQTPGATGAPLADRLSDFYAAWNDPEVDMILCVRGGRGCEELIANLDWGKLQPRKNLYFQGYSDVTLLTAALLSKGYGHPVAGPMAGSMSGLYAPYIKEMKAMYHGESVGPFKLTPLVPGDCAGLPLSGLLARLCLVARSNYCPDTAGRIIFIEAVAHKPKVIRERLQEMLESKFFAHAAGVVFCHFIRSGSQAEIDAILQEFAPKFGVPVYKGFPFGHSPECCTIDFSRKVEIKNGELVFP